MAEDSHPGPRERWHRTQIRSWLGLALAGGGIVLLWLGWYRIAGETLVAAQLPYLASASIPGAALVVAGVLLLGGELSRRETQRAEDMVGVLYRLLTEDAGAPGPDDHGAEVGARLVGLPGGDRYHRPGCLLVEGKPEVRDLQPDEIGAAAMRPCPVCAPPSIEA